MSIFPNVPNVPGVPPLLRNPNAIFSTVTLLAADVSFLLGLFLGPQWGLFRTSGEVVVAADSVVSFDFKQDWTVSNYPVEPNAFASYDKVELPFTVRLRFSSGGSEFDRRALINSIDNIAGTLELFDAVTPERVYPSVNVMHFDYDRTAVKGVGLLIIDVWCIEVRVAQDAAFTSSGTGQSSTAQISGINTKSPSGASPVSGGTVQPSEFTGSTADLVVH